MSPSHNWEIKISHEGLHAYRVIRGSSKEEVELKARLQQAVWHERWTRLQQADAERSRRIQARTGWEKQADRDRRAKAEALRLTKETEAAIAAAKHLLEDGLGKAHSLDWESIKDSAPFSRPQPTAPELGGLPPEPNRAEGRFRTRLLPPEITLFDKIIPGRKQRKLANAEAAAELARSQIERQFNDAHTEWRRQADEIKHGNDFALLNYERAKAAWLLEKKMFVEIQARFNSEIQALRKAYFDGHEDAITQYCREILDRTEYATSFPKDIQVQFSKSTGLLVVEYELPSEKAIPKRKGYKYSTTRCEFQEVPMSDAEYKRLYDEVLYQICLRSLYELFKSDEIDAITTVVFNGWVQAVDKATGADTHPCVMTIQVTKNDFMALNLAQVELKACFRSLKGISGSRLIDFTPVRPVLTLNKEDPRFVASYGVAEALDEKTNLAAMDWLDFENLIRELFEKEFSKDGGEVKITQASRDGGVDAIAFDPDPLRGGKIVIQAKRYTNTVGIAAVRDLFGTVHNEGATKGILVTTSDYGPDAYEFIKGKPLTLLSGSELLYLLQKHGYHAKIDIKEAKESLGENS